jgi:hypothetical protein
MVNCIFVCIDCMCVVNGMENTFQFNKYLCIQQTSCDQCVYETDCELFIYKNVWRNRCESFMVLWTIMRKKPNHDVE